MQGFEAGLCEFGDVIRAPFNVFFACWILLGIASWVFYSKAAYRTKKSAHPFIVVGSGIAFFAFTEWLTRGNIPWFFALAVVVIIFFNIRNTQFCPRCNATLYARGFSRPEFCWKCGAKLTPPDSETHYPQGK